MLCSTAQTSSETTVCWLHPPMRSHRNKNKKQISCSGMESESKERCCKKYLSAPERTPRKRVGTRQPVWGNSRAGWGHACGHRSWIYHTLQTGGPSFRIPTITAQHRASELIATGHSSSFLSRLLTLETQESWPRCAGTHNLGSHIIWETRNMGLSEVAASSQRLDPGEAHQRNSSPHIQRPRSAPYPGYFWALTWTISEL